MSDNDEIDFIGLTAEIVAAYVSNNTIAPNEISGLVGEIHGALTRISSGAGVAPVAAVASEPPKPVVPIKKSVTDDYIICLEDGKEFKSLKRHLRTSYNMSPEQYREKWGLKPDYPMVAPNYAKARSELAKQMGLGQKRKRSR